VEPSIIVAIVSAAAAVTAAAIAALVSARGQRRNADNEQERLELDVWKDSVAELRTQVEDLRDEVKDCHAERDALTDEVGGMKVANTAMRMRIAVLEAHVESLTGKKLGGHDDMDT
jgi:septal ring factor EnvC (AmiA/AmiB activator)